MKTERNPLWRKGNRNISCPFYSECLDDAIKGSWEGWDCDDCPYKLNYENRPWVFLTVTDSIEY
jgi:hypothetical protein